MRRLLVVLGASLCVLLVPASARAATHAKLPCVVRGTIVTATGSSVLTRDREVRGAPARSYFACTRGHRARAIDSDGNVNGLSLSGHRVAWSFAACGTSSCLAEVVVLDLQTGHRRVHTLPDALSTTPLDVQLTRSGAVFWVARTAVPAPDGGYSSDYAVHRLDPSGTDTTLDAGPTVDPGSLAVTATTAYWLDAGRPRSAEAA